MIDQDKRLAIFRLHQEGMSLREISRCLQVSRHTVRAIVKQQGRIERKARRDKKPLDGELLARLYRECDGWTQRIHERLREEEKIAIGYSTLTRRVRELGLSQPAQQRCDRVPDEPGAEMQHDTSVYRVLLGMRWVRLIASLIYLRYSKRRYLKFYRAFNRFTMIWASTSGTSISTATSRCTATIIGSPGRGARRSRSWNTPIGCVSSSVTNA